MALFQVILDWSLMLLTLFGEMFYLWKIVREERSILMDMIKYLILNDILSFPVILFHDVPSYFMTVSLSDRFYFLKEMGIFAQCLPFFYALLMLPIFVLLSLFAIIAAYTFVSWKKRHISQFAIGICYFLSTAMSVPLMTEYCGFNYDNKTHYWYYDKEKPYTEIYRLFNQCLQLVVFAIVGICMSIVMVYMVKRSKRVAVLSSRVRNSISIIPGQTSTSVSTGTHVSSQMSHGSLPNLLGVPNLGVQSSVPRNEFRTGPTAVSFPGIQKVVEDSETRNRSITDQAFAFFVLCLCFMAGTICFNFVYCSATVCMIFTVTSAWLNRSKWLIYCFLMRRQATLSRIFK